MNITITQNLRPVKLACLILPNSKSSYLRALQICSSLWGGKHFPIIPIYKKFTEKYRSEYRIYIKPPIEFYRNTLKNFDPDFLVIDEGIDRAYIKGLNLNREIVSMVDVENSLANDESQYGISICEIIEKIKEKEFKYDRTDSLKLCCPKISKRDLYTMTICGNVSSDSFEKIKRIQFPMKYISYPRINEGNLHKCVGTQILNYLSLVTYDTNTYGNPLWTSGFGIYITRKDYLNDLLNIWNYRALGWNIVAVPEESINDPYYLGQIEKQQTEFNKYTRLGDRIKVITNWEISRETVNSYLNLLNSIHSEPAKRGNYIHQWWLPRYWETGQFLSYDRSAAIEIRSAQKQTILSVDDAKIQIPVLRPAFNKKYVRHIKPRYVNEVLLQFDEMEGKYAQILPELETKDLDYLIKGSGFGQWVFSDGIPYFLAQERDDYLSLSIPKASDVFTKWLGARNIQIRHSPPGKLGSQLLKNIGGIYGTNFLANSGIVPVLSHFENGKTVLKQTIENELSKQIQLNKFRENDRATIMAKLLDKNIIEFGAEVQCTFCNQHSFYKINDLLEKIKCPICQNSFFIPAYNANKIKWAYRGMGPFSRNNKADGLLCVLLTLRFFRVTMHPDRITPLLSFELLQNKQAINEVDLAVFYGKEYRTYEPPDLFLAECKTEIDFMDADVEKMKKLGQLFPGSVLTFATLKSILSNNEKERIKKIVNFFRKGFGPRPTNPILILTGNELLPTNTFQPFANIQDRFIDHLRYSDEVNHLSDVTCQHYLDLPSFGSIIERKSEIRAKAWEEKRKKGDPSGGSGESI
jgi:hypothetical protein